ncbi:MAG: VOC family protein, partial [Candidatus Heimdallarchaeota archaeon]
IPNKHTIVQVSPTGERPGIELWYDPSQSLFKNDRLHFAFSSDDVPGLIADLREKNVFVEQEPFQIGRETIAFVRDPDGYLIEFTDDGGDLEALGVIFRGYSDTEVLFVDYVNYI